MKFNNSCRAKKYLITFILSIHKNIVRNILLFVLLLLGIIAIKKLFQIFPQTKENKIIRPYISV